ncbi:hypothetical protein Moror_4982 [Moniliophthora roreri MCA 2997]|uniref:Uncharacterized protein n=3 Tax=Moniliophthora roreri TaxID=221103 RepID=V2Y430_MONRO|nr:hypothetical protein Moror_4982 [Moniliophthora roreri MCA 2997]
MILVQKPASFSTAPHHVHRRHPSAPSPVVVQPTRTPGLLTLSKPIQQQPRQRNTPKPKQAAAKTSPRHQQQQSSDISAVLKPSPEILDRKPGTPVSAEKAHPRGRQQHSKPKDKQTPRLTFAVKSSRSSSNSSVRGRRHNARQPSPPLPANLSSQAEASSPPYKSTTSNLFDPFLDDSTPPSRSKPIRPAPTLASRPSGKLAKRRQPNSVPFNPAPTPASTPARAIPVPRRNYSSNSVFSRSAPTGDHVPHRMPVKASSEPPDVFPICDDVSEAGNDSEAEDMSPPSTPTRRTRSSARFAFDDGPRTAPITASTKSFPFNNTSPSSVASRKARKHARVPSEGVFAMSSDEEASTGGVGSDDLKALFAMLPRRRPTVSLTESERERAAAAAAAYFASSNFQNSPSPEDLPPPSFV